MSDKLGKPNGAPIILDDPQQGFTYSQSKTIRERLKPRLNSSFWQWLIIGLVICDAFLVGTDIILSSVYCSSDHPPHSVEVLEEWLRIGSIIILTFFVLEWLLEAWVHGFQRWTYSWIHRFDLLIVVISLALEYLALLTHEKGLNVGGLLVVFRLWRVVRVMHAVQEVQHKKTHEKIASLQETTKQLHEIQKAHHDIVKGLHHEFVNRLNAVRSARLEHLCQDASAEIPVLKEENPTLDDLLTSVGSHSMDLRDKVMLHRRSLHIAQAVEEGKEMQPGESENEAVMRSKIGAFTDIHEVDMDTKEKEKL